MVIFFKIYTSWQFFSILYTSLDPLASWKHQQQQPSLFFSEGIPCDDITVWEVVSQLSAFLQNNLIGYPLILAELFTLNEEGSFRICKLVGHDNIFYFPSVAEGRKLEPLRTELAINVFGVLCCTSLLHLQCLLVSLVKGGDNLHAEIHFRAD